MYRFTHNPTGFQWDRTYAPTIVTWAINGHKDIQDKIRARMYRAVNDLKDSERRRQIYSEYDEFLWSDIDVRPLI